MPGENRSGVRCLLYRDETLKLNVSDTDRVSHHSLPARDRRALLSVENLRVHFPVRKGLLQPVVGQLKAVDGVDLDIVRGSVVALVGESGCGKSTLGKAILKLIDSTGGRIVIDGKSLSGMRGERSETPAWRYPDYLPGSGIIDESQDEGG